MHPNNAEFQALQEEVQWLREQHNKHITQLEIAKQGLEYLYNNDVRYNVFELKQEAWKIWKSIE